MWFLFFINAVPLKSKKKLLKKQIQEPQKTIDKAFPDRMWIQGLNKELPTWPSDLQKFPIAMKLPCFSPSSIFQMKNLIEAILIALHYSLLGVSWDVEK